MEDTDGVRVRKFKERIEDDRKEDGDDPGARETVEKSTALATVDTFDLTLGEGEGIGCGEDAAGIDL